MNNNRKNNIDWVGWIFTMIMLGSFWPVGLILLFRQLKKTQERSTQVKRHSYDVQQDEHKEEWTEDFSAQRSVSGYDRQKSAKKQKKTTRKKRKNRDPISEKISGKWLSLAGAAMTGLFGLSLLMTVSEILSWGWNSSDLEDLFTLFGLFLCGIVCLCMGLKRKRKAKRYRSYLAYIGKNESISLTALSSAMGISEKMICGDLQDMLDLEILPTGYIDLATGRLVLSDEGISDVTEEVKEESAPEQQVKQVLEDENAILQEIREVNDAIPDEVMSAKIDRIGEITGKILDYQRSHPGKSGQLRSFLNYYLPTTLKILRAYAQLDAQGIEGENISTAKHRIEGMMDHVVDGFEKQLDKLFQDDALDVASDVEVLENMLRQDGLFGNAMVMCDLQSTGAKDISAQQAYLDLQKVAEELNQIAREDPDITLKL